MVLAAARPRSTALEAGVGAAWGVLALVAAFMAKGGFAVEE